MGGQSTDRPRRFSAAAAPALWVLQFIAAAVSTAIIWLQRMAVAGCGNRCDYRLLSLVGTGLPLVLSALLIVTGALLIALPYARRTRQQPRRSDAWAPAAGLAVTIILACVASGLVDRATQPA